VLKEPSARVGERIRGQLTIRDAADLRPRDQARLLEDAQMLGNGWCRDVERLAQDPDGTWVPSQPLEHRATCRVGQRAEDRIE
jgi:hypothetical protein